MNGSPAATPNGRGAERLRVREIYRSIQGESSFAGWPCAFVRTVGCDIRCVWCDEPQAFQGGEWLALDDVLARVRALGVPLVEITGGEPLLWRSVPSLVSRLCDSGYEVLVETGGHHPISELDSRCHAIVDVKAPGSGMSARNHLANLKCLRAGDEVKLVLRDRADYEWARALVREHALERWPVHLSPVHGELDPAALAKWMLADGLRVRLNLQLHKLVWGPDASGV